MEPSRINNKGYLIAKGPEDLERVLNDVWRNPDLKSQSQNILYSLGQQLALIKVDFSSKEAKVWHVDVTVPFARPATQSIKDAVNNFGFESNINLIFSDQTLNQIFEKQSAFLHGAKMNIDQDEIQLPDDQQANANDLLQELSSALPGIKPENVTNLLLAQLELRKVLAADYGQKGVKYPGFFDKDKATEVLSKTDKKRIAPEPTSTNTDTKRFKP